MWVKLECVEALLSPGPNTEFVQRKNEQEKNLKVEKWSWKGKRKPSQIQKRKTIADMVVIITRLIIENHVHQFNGKLYLQSPEDYPNPL